jgi:hypothetical protein
MILRNLLKAAYEREPHDAAESPADAPAVHS